MIMKNLGAKAVCFFLLIVAPSISAFGVIPDFRADIEVSKFVSTNSTDYEIEFDIQDAGADTRRVWVRLPNGQTTTIVNRFGIDDFLLFDAGMTENQFDNKYPKGIYEIIAFHPLSGLNKLIIDVPDGFLPLFPTAPNIITPLDGEIVELTMLDIAWEKGDINDNIREWDIAIDGPGVEFDLNVPVDVTEFTVPLTLELGTTYRLCVGANIDPEGNPVGAETNQCITFITPNAIAPVGF